MSAHTPGPWFVSERGFSRRNPAPTVYAVDTDLRYIAYCNDFLNFGEPTDNLANARLIAAAPELLAALEQAVTSMQDSGYPNTHVVVRSARAAIAKAIGGAA